METVKELAKVMHEQCPYESKMNGRCEYHDDLVRAVHVVSGMVKIMLVVQGVLTAAIFVHMGFMSG